MLCQTSVPRRKNEIEGTFPPLVASNLRLDTGISAGTGNGVARLTPRERGRRRAVLKGGGGVGGDGDSGERGGFNFQKRLGERPGKTP